MESTAEVSASCESTGSGLHMVANPLSTREIAIGIWLLVFIGIAATNAEVRKSFQRVLGGVFRWRLMVPVLAAAAYTALIVQGLAMLCLWTPDLLKDTILWFLFAGVALAFSGITQSWEPIRWHKIIADQIAVIVLVEYLVNTYTFSLPLELLIVPALTTVAIFDAIARTDSRFASVAKMTGCLQGLLVIGVLAFAISQAVTHLDQLATWNSVRVVALAPLLSVLILPFVYGFTLVSAYEQLFIRLRFAEEKERGLIRYIKWQLFKHLGTRHSAVGAFGREHALDLSRVKSKEDVDRLFRQDSKA